jgi:tRNA uridine 5-carboxymethylaminomethyl modification enzyme
VKGTAIGLEGDTRSQTHREWLSRPEVADAARTRFAEDEAMLEAIDDSIYAPYLERQQREASARHRDRLITISGSFDFAAVPGLSSEMLERLTLVRPANLDEASRIAGVTPAALSALHFALVRQAA